MTAAFRLGVFCVHGLRSFSGIPHAIVQTLRQQGGVEVVLLPAGPPHRPALVKRVLCRAQRALTGRAYLWEKEPARCRHISRQLDVAVQQHGVDAVLLFGSEGCACSETSVPLYAYCDSLFGTRLDLYPDQLLARLSRQGIQDGKRMQQLALDRLSRVFISSRWALERALACCGYTVSGDRVEVVGIGANLPAIPGVGHSPATNAEEVQFLWVGSYWERKGGEFAVDVVQGLRGRGLNAVLNVVGPVQPRRVFPWLRRHGRLDYENATDFGTVVRLYEKAQALLLPTTADTTPLAISEAFAFGRPAIATPVGGIPEMITDGQTGFLIPPGDPARWAERIAEGIRSGALAAMGPACRARFDADLNWAAVCGRMLAAMTRCARNGQSLFLGDRSTS
jgi:glycosyltransferase involved in cell wall biosynthesis